MKRAVLIAALLASCSGPAYADQCSYENVVETKYHGRIDKVTDYSYNVQSYVDDTHKCIVKFTGHSGFKTYTARGTYVFGHDLSVNDACNQAELRAKQEMLRALASEHISGKVNLKCLSNTVKVKEDSFLKKTGKVSFRIFELAMCGQPDCLK